MTISILKLNTADGHKIPRPFNRACSRPEMEEMLSHYCSNNGWSFERCAAGQQYFPENRDTDKPVLTILGTTIKFFAFTE